MRRFGIFMLTLIVVGGALTGGCTKKQAQNSREAIEQAQKQTDAKAQADYLLQQARNFIKQQDFNEAIAVANYVRKNYAEYRDQAARIIETAKARLREQAQAAVDEAQKKIDSTAGDLKTKIGSLGQ